MIPFDIGDPASPNAGFAAGTPITLPGSTAKIIAINDTPYQILLTFSGLSGTPYKVPSGWARILPVAANQQQVTWTIDKSLSPSLALISDLTLECYMVGEELPTMHPIIRQIGGSVKAVSATQVQNDGMPLGTAFVEATAQVPNGISPFGSNVIIDNDGNFYFMGLSNGSPENFMQSSTIAGRVNILIGNQDVPVQLGASGGQTNGDVTIRAGARLLGGGGVFIVDTFGNITGLGLTLGAAALLDNGALVTGSGTLTKYANVATAGQGVPPIRAVLEPPTTIAVTTLQNVLTFTPNANGLYVAYMRVRLNNGTSPQLMQCRVQYTDPDTGSTPAVPFQMINAAGTVQTATGVGTNFANGTWDSLPIFFRAKGLAAITLQYQDPANTPNDQVNGAILQIA